jgi:hypothetical protein
MISQAQYANFKETSLRNQPLRKTIALTDLRFITMDLVEFNGLKLGVDRQAIKDLLQIVGFSSTGLKNLTSSVGEDGAQMFLNSLKNAIGQNKSMQVTIAVTPDRIISRIQKEGASAIISAETYFDTFERLANTHNLEITSTDFNKGNGNIYIRAINGKGNQHQVENLSNEVFQTGISLARTANGLQADPYMDRLVCTNGNVLRAFDESFNLRSMDARTWQEFYEHMERIEKMNFVPTAFNQKVIEAINTPASLLELEQGANLLLNNSNIQQNELEMFFKGHKNTYNRMHAANIDTAKINAKQKANLRTGVSVWDVINGVTDFASHNYGFEKKANSDTHLQMVAGDILAKNFDTANLVLNQPF